MLRHMASKKRNTYRGPALVRLWRTAEGISQAELGTRCGYDGSAIRHYEGGRERGSLKLCVCLAKVTGVPLEALLHPERVEELREACALLNGEVAA